MSMTQQQARDRVDTIVQHMYDAVGGEPAPLCEVLDAELQFEDSDEFDGHEYIHALANTFALAAQMKGAMSAADIAIYVFVIGRKWGLLEAADSMFEVPDGPAA